MANQQPLNSRQESDSSDDLSVRPCSCAGQKAERFAFNEENRDLEPEAAPVSLIENWIDA